MAVGKETTEGGVAERGSEEGGNSTVTEEAEGEGEAGTS